MTMMQTASIFSIRVLKTLNFKYKGTVTHDQIVIVCQFIILSDRHKEHIGATEFHWTPEERRQHINIIRGMRAMQNYMCARIRRGLSFRRTPEAVVAFLDRLETECQHVESHDSDELF